MDAKNLVVMVAVGLFVGCGPSLDKDQPPIIIVTDEEMNAANAGGSAQPGGATTEGGQTEGGQTEGGQTEGEPKTCSDAVERLVDGECVAVERYLAITANRVQSDNNGSVSEFASIQACPMVATGAEPQIWEPIYDDGTCVAYRITGEEAARARYETNPELDMGAVTVQADGQDPFAMQPAGGACFTVPYQAAMSWIMAGSSLTFRTEGGADMPAYETTVSVPEPTALTHSEVLSGEPIEVEWTAGNGPVTLNVMATQMVDGSQVGVTINCEVNDSGSFVVPAAATEHVPADANFRSVSLSRTSRQTEFVDDVMFDSLAAGTTQSMTSY